MANTKSAKKAIRSSEKKRQHNLFWKRRITAVKKSFQKALSDKTPDLKALKEYQVALQKVLDKSVKNNVIHKSKANRLKSRYASKVAAHETKKPKTTKKTTKPASTKK